MELFCKTDKGMGGSRFGPLGLHDKDKHEEAPVWGILKTLEVG